MLCSSSNMGHYYSIYFFFKESSSTEHTQPIGSFGGDNEIPNNIFVSLYKLSEFICGGVFISLKHILILNTCTCKISSPLQHISVKFHSGETLTFKNIVYRDENAFSIGIIIVSRSL